MALPADLQARLDKVAAAFKADGFEVVNYCLHNDHIGVSAAYGCSSQDTVTKSKLAYYVEGDHATMGWLLGFMAEPAVARMTTEYRAKAIGAFIDPEAQESGLMKDIEKGLARHCLSMGRQDEE